MFVHAKFYISDFYKISFLITLLTISLMLDLDAFQAKPAECFSAVEKLLMACCTMQPEDGALPRGDADGEG